MAMNNPALSRNKGFSDNPTAEEIQALYDAPSANKAPESAMTIEGSLARIGITFAFLVAAAVVGWIVTTMYPLVAIGALWATLIVGLVLGMVNIFKKEPSPALILAYAVVQGFMLGTISNIFESQWKGIVFQAILATIVVVGVTLALFASGKIRASKRATRVFIIALVGYMVYMIVNIFVMMFNPALGPFGLSSVTLFGIPLGVIIGIFVVIMAAYSLVLDFDFIQRGIQNKIPVKYAWTGAFAVMVTVIWLYMQILQMLAIARR